MHSVSSIGSRHKAYIPVINESTAGLGEICRPHVIFPSTMIKASLSLLD